MDIFIVDLAGLLPDWKSAAILLPLTVAGQHVEIVAYTITTR